MHGIAPQDKLHYVMTSLLTRLLVVFCLLLSACRVSGDQGISDTSNPTFDVIIRNGTVYDGSGSPPIEADVAVNADTIAAIGRLENVGARSEIDARGMAVVPGFINMLSWANTSLIEDGRSQSDVRQGVTLEIFGEGTSMGPLNDSMKKDLREIQSDIRYDVTWTTLGEYLDDLVGRGVSTNVASFVGATTVRIHELGYEDRAPTSAELNRMRALVRQAMEEGALGLGTSLIYVPASFSTTEELIELAKVAAEYDGLYISHIRSEGGRLLEAVEEVLQIARRAGIRAEIYHLKASGRDNWHKMDSVIAVVEQARANGIEITADMYTYPASSTGLTVAIPSWAQEGGHEALVERLNDPATRSKIRAELDMRPADKTLLVSFRSDRLKPLIGKTLAEAAELRGMAPADVLLDLIVEDDSRVGVVYFMMSEENLRKQIRLPWVSFGSDGGSMSAEGVFLKNNTHPRAYGNFARLLRKYVREEQLISLEEAIRRLTSLPASNLKIDRRGRLAPGYFADVVVFDPDRVQDHATFEEPHQYATGVVHVLVNGTPVIKDGEHTGATPGTVVHGPGWKR